MPFEWNKFEMPRRTDGAAINPGVVKEDDLREAGFEFASSQFPNEYLFSRMGGWNVSVRASIIRITFFKLLGTGVAALFMATSPHVGSYTAWSLAMSAAVNLVACGHYYWIWQVRLQTYRGPKYDQWMAKVGRAPAEDNKLLEQETKHDKRAVFFQEVTVDGLRHSDWLCTLVLLTLDLGHLRTYLHFATAGVIPEMPIAKEWVASMQALMIFFASVYRFYLNEGRSYLDGSGGTSPPNWPTFTMAVLSYISACVLFGYIVWALVDGLPATSDAFPAHVNTDIICLQVFVWVWVGYPVVSIASRLGHWGLDGDYYNATWSLLKDVGFAFLDVSSKAGLAIFFVLKAAWVTRDSEDALVAAGKLALNVTS